MRQVTFAVGLVALCSFGIPAHAGTLRCPPDSVKVGNVCIDTYEASVWQIPPSNTVLVKKVQQGKVTLADLTAAGATEVSLCGTGLPPDPGDFPARGNWDPGPRIESARAGFLRALDPGGEADRLHHLVPGEPGLPPLREAAAHEPRVARSGDGDARPGACGRRRDDVRDACARVGARPPRDGVTQELAV